MIHGSRQSLIQLRNSQRKIPLDVSKIKKAAQVALESLGLEDQELSVLITDNQQMAHMHEIWMSKPGPTDVLSFSYRDRKSVFSGLLGDIAISAEMAAQQARKRSRGTRADQILRQVIALLIHGILHLAGHDHVKLSDKQRMQQQARRLYRLVEQTL